MDLSKFKEIFKDKRFLIALIIVIIIGLFFYFRNRSQSNVGTTEPEATTGSYGSGTDSYTPSNMGTTSTPLVNTPAVTTPVASSKGEEIDNGKTDKLEQVAPKIDENRKKQEASNQIYDLKDLWTNTSKEFGSNPTTEQNAILQDIHQKAQNIATQAGLGNGGEEGNYSGILKDTRNYNAITGESSFHPGEEILTTAVKNQRIQAQQEIDQLKNQYTLTSDAAEQNRIHQQAEKIGIEAGLGVGGESGIGRKKVNLKTGEFE